METTLAAESRVYRTVPFTDEYCFVFITQGLETLERMWDGTYSVEPFALEGSDLLYLMVPDLLFLRDIREMSTSHPDERVRQKHTTALGILRARYPAILGWLDTHAFDITSISPAANWAGVIDRYPEAYTWAIKTRMTY
jgi:hypothetical protein